jgi:hypothetical protein
LSLGDFDLDDRLDADDIDLLNGAIGSASEDLAFDLNGNGNVDAGDSRFWVERVRGTFVGDANLDGRFTTRDLVVVFQAGTYQDNVPNNSSWDDGDWTGDAEFTQLDLVEAFQHGGFEQGPRAVVKVTELSPSGNQDVPTDQQIIVRFDGPVDRSTVNVNSIYLLAGGQRVQGRAR